MKKALISALLTISICMSLIPMAALAEEQTDDGGFVIQDGVLLEYNGPGGDVVIPDSVSFIPEEFHYDSEMSSLNAITSLVIPSSVKYIGEFAFSNCGELEKVTIHGGIKSIPDGTFAGCSKLTEVELPDSLQSIGASSFSGCGLKKIVIPNGVTNISYSAFKDCSELVYVAIPPSVTFSTFIGFDSLFQNCSNDLTIYGLTGSDAERFANEYEKSFETVDAAFWSAVPARTTAEATDDGFVIQDGILLEYNGPGGDVAIPDSVSFIPKEFNNDSDFFSLNAITSLTIPGCVKYIGGYAFSDCGELEKVTILDGVKRISDGMFDGCSKLTEVELPDSLKSIGAYSFSSCGLKKIVIPNGVATIKMCAFEKCRDLEYVAIPPSVTEIALPQIYSGAVFLDCSDSLTIYGVEGSYAQEFSKIGGWDGVYSGNVAIGCPIPFVAVGPELWGVKDGETTGLFSDVDASAYYFDAVNWAVENGITTGTTDKTFSPDVDCTRGQIITFLWRAAGCPEPTGDNPFSDVTPGAYFDKATAWAAEKGLASGTSFEAELPCTRLMAVEFMWKYAGSPSASPAAFRDVASDAVNWALEKGVTTGTGDGEFSPNAICSRAQIVTFLYRAFA